MDKSKTFDSYIKNKNIEQHQKKIDQILELFDEIELAMKNGASIQHLWMWLQEYHDIDISKSYFNTILYRLRKSKGLTKKRTSTTPNIQHQKTTSNSSLVAPETNADKKALYEAAMEKHSAATNLSEKFLALGGEPSDIVDKPDSQIRHIYTKQKIKFNRLYDEFL